MNNTIDLHGYSEPIDYVLICFAKTCRIQYVGQPK